MFRLALTGWLLFPLAAQAVGNLPPPQRRLGGGSITLHPTTPTPRQPPQGKRLASDKRARPKPPPVPLATASLALRPAGDAKDPREQRIGHLRERLTDLLRSPPLSHLRVGLVVQEIDSGEVLAAHNADVAFNPASNTKILTTAAALKLLGADWRYRTVLLAPLPSAAATADLSNEAHGAPPEASVLVGDLFLQGSGDPSLNVQGLAEMARSLARGGVTRIEGDILVDGQLRDLSPEHAGPALGGGAILLNRNSYAVHVSPGSAGQPAAAWVEPRFFALESHIQTVKGKRSRLQVSHYLQNGRLIVTVHGRIGAAHGDQTVRGSFGESAALAAATLRQALSDFGIQITGQVRVAPPPAGPLRIVAEHRSVPLSDICGLSNKDSNNFVADTIFKTLGGERYGLPGTLQKGSRAVSDFLTQLGMDPTRVHLVNGSGLTHENRLRPVDLNNLLRKLFHDLQLAPEFLQSLAIGGIDGTIRYRFHGPAVGLVRAKTGTLSGVSALSGYVGEHRDVLAFTILMEGFGQKRLDQVRHAQVEIVEALLHYLRSDGDRSPASPLLPRSPLGDAPASGEDEGEGEDEAGAPGVSLAPARAPSSMTASNLGPSSSPAKSAW